MVSWSCLSSTRRSVTTTTESNTLRSWSSCRLWSRCASQAMELDLPLPAECCTRYRCLGLGLDHGAGHSLLLLCDAKASRGEKSMKFKGLGDDLFNVFISLF